MSAEDGPVPALHTVGSRVWVVSDAADGWTKAEVTRIEQGGSLTIRMEDGTEKVCQQEDIPLQNPGKHGVEVSGAAGGSGAGRSQCRRQLLNLEQANVHVAASSMMLTRFISACRT